MLEKQFHLKEHGTTVHTEIIGGITTFLSMAYILAVNPSILGAVMDPGGVFAATALASGVATLVMALYANYPIALSAGLGVHAYFAYTVCLGELGGAGGAFRIALAAVLVEGIIFIIMSFFKIREQIVNSIPENLKFGITCGIGLFITFIGFVNAGIVINDDATLVGQDGGSRSGPDRIPDYHHTDPLQRDRCRSDRYHHHLDPGYDCSVHRLVSGRQCIP